MQPRIRETPQSPREPPAPAARASRIAEAERAPWVTWTRNLAVAAAAGVFLAFVGAMQTSAMPLLQRLAYWIPLMLAGALVGHGVSRAVGRFAPPAGSRWVFGAVVALVVAIPVTLLVWAYTGLMFGGVSLRALPGLFGGVLVISAAMTAIMMVANQPGRVTHAPPSGVLSVRFLERLPTKLKGAALYAVSAEDHYLRLHTSKGSDLILMRLADAVAELDGLEGAQTHRSWWVAKDAVESVRRDGGRVVLKLANGVEAPVSRPNVRQLRDAGWF